MLHDDRIHPVPQKTAVLAMWLFLLSLAMLFLSSMLGYVLIRLGVFGREDQPSLGTLNLPASLWVSTAVILLASVTAHLAVNAVKREKLGLLRRYLLATLLLSLAFILVQIPGLWSVLDSHRAARAAGGNLMLYGALFFLISVHALHVLGGLIYLIMVLMNASAGRYDHEHFIGVKHAALYWHFLDVVWLVMFGTMLVLR